MEKVLGRRSQWHLIGKELCVCCQTLIRFYQLRVAIHWSIRGYQRSAATDYHFERNTTDLRKMEAEQKINQVDDSDDLWMARVEHVPTRSLLGALWSERISVCPECVHKIQSWRRAAAQWAKNDGERSRGSCAELGSRLSKLVLFWKHRFCTGSWTEDKSEGRALNGHLGRQSEGLRMLRAVVKK